MLVILFVPYNLLSFALGRRFRIYSFVTLAVVIVDASWPAFWPVRCPARRPGSAWPSA
jgi:hypothetical protein